MAIQPAGYPVTLEIDTPAALSRWLWLFKWLIAIPHMIILAILGFVSWFTLLASWLAILVTGSRPRGLFDFHLGIQRWSTRVNVYLYHLTDVYPPFTLDEESQYAARFNADYVAKANRLTTFFRYFLAIPHFIVLWFLSIIAFFVLFAHIVVVIFTGKPNDGMFKFLVGYSRWSARVNGYYWLMTDEYPPFSMD